VPRTGRLLSIAVACLLVPAVRTPAQGVVITPHFVFIPEASRTTTIELHNTDSVSTEITIETVDGTYRTDSAGGIIVVHDTSALAAAHSAAAWVQIYPRHVTLHPGERQTVKLLASPPADLGAGEYRARLVVGARPVTARQPATSEGQTRIALNFEVQTSLSLIYRKGTVSTGVKIEEIRATVNGDYLDVRAHLEKTGNASFFGRLRGSLVDDTGRTVVALEQVFGLNESMSPRFRMSLGPIRSGTYTLKLAITTERPDIPPDNLVAAPTERWEGKIVVQRGY
jgi:P pilus assembly chaperone PapD